MEDIEALAREFEVALKVEQIGERGNFGLASSKKLPLATKSDWIMAFLVGEKIVYMGNNGIDLRIAMQEIIRP